jgi:hypothetical protein
MGKNVLYFTLQHSLKGRLCDLVARVPDPEVSCSIPGTTRFSEK